MNFVALEGSFPLDTALPLLKDDDEFVVGELPAAFAHNDLRARSFLEVRRLAHETHSQHVCFDEDVEVVGSHFLRWLDVYADGLASLVPLVDDVPSVMELIPLTLTLCYTAVVHGENEFCFLFFGRFTFQILVNDLFAD